MPLSSPGLGTLRAPTPSLTKAGTGSRRHYLIHNKSDEDIAREYKNTGPKTEDDATTTLKALGLNIADTNDIDLHLLSRTIKELSIQPPGAWPSFSEALKAIGFLLEKFADNSPQTPTPTNETDQPYYHHHQEDMENKLRKIDDRVQQQENKIDTLTETTKKIEELVQKINENTDKDKYTPTATTKPTYAAISRPTIPVPAKHMEIIARNENKSRQVLVKTQPELIKTLANERTMVTKANLALNQCVDPPSNTEFISAQRVREDTIRYELNTAAGALWLKIKENAESFITKFNVDLNIVNESEKLIAEFVPVTLDPTNTTTIREIERRSDLQANAITSIEWIKRIDHRKPEQKVAFATIRITNNTDANKAIRDGLVIEGKRVSLTRAQPDPSRCFNCQTFPKPFHLAKDCPNKSRCGTCGEEEPDHSTHDCPVTAPEAHFCASCDTKGHPSWSRNCPTFLEEKKKLQLRRKSNNYRFFPVAEDPSTWEEINPASPPMAPPLSSTRQNTQLTTDPPADPPIEDEPHAYFKTTGRYDNRKAGTLTSTSRNPTFRRTRGGRHNPDRFSARDPTQSNLNGYVQTSQKDKNREAPERVKQTISPLSSHPQHDKHTNQPPLPPLPPSSPFSPSRPIRESLHISQ